MKYSGQVKNLYPEFILLKVVSTEKETKTGVVSDYACFG